MNVFSLNLLHSVASHDLISNLVIFLTDHQRGVLVVIKSLSCLHLILLLYFLNDLFHHLFFIKCELTKLSLVPCVLQEEVSLLQVCRLLVDLNASLCSHMILLVSLSTDASLMT